uniref:Uncharacterized protein n=1 Tax=Polytomella parva TaxID=51329 RepID=A0A7S0YDP1_9CHLO|mmetsp:Transcript_20047/g.36045  ORF Transcript_20047/g.36045 Transcript_20047/m.36045 type:complete len:404 (+) Transcript_20047:3-1214(+)
MGMGTVGGREGRGVRGGGSMAPYVPSAFSYSYDSTERQLRQEKERQEKACQQQLSRLLDHLFFSMTSTATLANHLGGGSGMSAKEPGEERGEDENSRVSDADASQKRGKSGNNSTPANNGSTWTTVAAHESVQSVVARLLACTEEEDEEDYDLVHDNWRAAANGGNNPDHYNNGMNGKVVKNSEPMNNVYDFYNPGSSGPSDGTKNNNYSKESDGNQDEMLSNNNINGNNNNNSRTNMRRSNNSKSSSESMGSAGKGRNDKSNNGCSNKTSLNAFPTRRGSGGSGNYDSTLALWTAKGSFNSNNYNNTANADCHSHYSNNDMDSAGNSHSNYNSQRANNNDNRDSSYSNDNNNYNTNNDYEGSYRNSYHDGSRDSGSSHDMAFYPPSWSPKGPINAVQPSPRR